MRIIIEAALGEVNAINTVFYTTVAYKPGSLRVYLNGGLKNSIREDGFVEDKLNKFRMKIAPISGDFVDVQYSPI